MSQGQLQLNVWEELIKSGKYLSCLALRGRNEREEWIDLQHKIHCGHRNSFREKKPCQDRKRAKARGWQLNLEMIRENKSERNSERERGAENASKVVTAAGL